MVPNWPQWDAESWLCFVKHTCPGFPGVPFSLDRPCPRRSLVHSDPSTGGPCGGHFTQLAKTNNGDESFLMQVTHRCIKYVITVTLCPWTIPSHPPGDQSAISCRHSQQFVSLVEAWNVNGCWCESIYELIFRAVYCRLLLLSFRTP